MDRSFLFLSGVVMSLFCTVLYLYDLGISLPLNNIVIDTIRGQKKRLATIWEPIEDYSEEQEGATQESSIYDNKKIEEKANGRKYFSKEAIKLCSSETRLPTVIQKKLKCRYVDLSNPYLKIAPFKEEEAYLDPRIVIYHNVIYNEEVETLKKLSEPQLESAQAINSATGKPIAPTNRISKTAWVEEEGNRHLKLLNRRVKHMTNLTLDTAEDFQVAFYSVGGLFLPHRDYFDMNDVEKGGATIFTKLNITIWPQKGSALFWFNLKQSGEKDLSTSHAACPVLTGTKWIATKWIHEKGQEFLRPCPLLKNGLNYQ